jgi:hypothetical protein
MTIISTHRVHSYKASTTLQRRDVSPKKVSLRKTSNDKKINKQTPYILNTDITLENINIQNFIELIKTSAINYISSFQYKVLTPNTYSYEDTDLDISSKDELLEEDIENALAHYDYLEYLYD